MARQLCRGLGPVPLVQMQRDCRASGGLTPTQEASGTHPGEAGDPGLAGRGVRPWEHTLVGPSRVPHQWVSLAPVMEAMAGWLAGWCDVGLLVAGVAPVCRPSSSTPGARGRQDHVMCPMVPLTTVGGKVGVGNASLSSRGTGERGAGDGPGRHRPSCHSQQLEQPRGGAEAASRQLGSPVGTELRAAALTPFLSSGAAQSAANSEKQSVPIRRTFSPTADKWGARVPTWPSAVSQ